MPAILLEAVCNYSLLVIRHSVLVWNFFDMNSKTLESLNDTNIDFFFLNKHNISFVDIYQICGQQ